MSFDTGFTGRPKHERFWNIKKMGRTRQISCRSHIPGINFSMLCCKGRGSYHLCGAVMYVGKNDTMMMMIIGFL